MVKFIFCAENWNAKIQKSARILSFCQENLRGLCVAKSQFCSFCTVLDWRLRKHILLVTNLNMYRNQIIYDKKLCAVLTNILKNLRTQKHLKSLHGKLNFTVWGSLNATWCNCHFVHAKRQMCLVARRWHGLLRVRGLKVCFVKHLEIKRGHHHFMA